MHENGNFEVTHYCLQTNPSPGINYGHLFINQRLVSTQKSINQKWSMDRRWCVLYQSSDKAYKKTPVTWDEEQTLETIKVLFAYMGKMSKQQIEINCESGRILRNHSNITLLGHFYDFSPPTSCVSKSANILFCYLWQLFLIPFELSPHLTRQFQVQWKMSTFDMCVPWGLFLSFFLLSYNILFIMHYSKV